MNRIAAQSKYDLTVLLLAVALLFAQWAGLQHRVSHARLQAHGQIAKHISYRVPVDDDSNTSHSCAAFDAATIGDSVHLVPFVAPLLANGRWLALWAAFISWDASFFSNFSSRAPPSFDVPRRLAGVATDI